MSIFQIIFSKWSTDCDDESERLINLDIPHVNVDIQFEQHLSLLIDLILGKKIWIEDYSSLECFKMSILLDYLIVKDNKSIMSIYKRVIEKKNIDINQ